MTVPSNIKAESLVRHYLDSVYKPHKIELIRYDNFKRIDTDPKVKGYSLTCEYRVFNTTHRDAFMVDNSFTKVVAGYQSTY